MQITHFSELRVYQRSFALAGSIFLLTKHWPPEERFALTDQVRRAARSVGANISEAWGKRRYEAHFISKLSDADAENHETEHWLLSASRDGYLTETELFEMIEVKKDVGRMLGVMMQTQDHSCSGNRPPSSAVRPLYSVLRPPYSVFCPPSSAQASSQTSTTRFMAASRWSRRL